MNGFYALVEYFLHVSDGETLVGEVLGIIVVVELTGPALIIVVEGVIVLVVVTTVIAVAVVLANTKDCCNTLLHIGAEYIEKRKYMKLNIRHTALTQSL